VTPGNLEFVEVLASMTVNTAGIAAILVADERLRGHRWRATAWLPATRDAAILGAFLFGVLYAGPGLVIHFVKSRGWLTGLALGVAAAVLLVCVDVAAAATIEELFL
jgi:hypothetical protein